MEHPIAVSVGIIQSSTFLSDARTCIYKFPASKLLSLPTAHGLSDPGSAITALTQSPAIDVVGIGFTSGNIVIYDIRADEKLMRMFMEGGGIRALSFRSGGCLTNL